MPSNRNPKLVVNPTPGKLGAGAVPASALSFPINGGGDLAAHISDPVDAHLADAIGVPETYPATGAPLLSSAGGPYDGESVLDALYSLSELLPIKPDRLGFDGSIANSGRMTWYIENGGSVEAGGFTLGGAGILTTNLSNISPGFSDSYGTIFPADRGVLAVYQTTGTNFFNAGQTTLLSALWLGPDPHPSGIPSAQFDPASKTGFQPATFTAPGSAGITGTYTPGLINLDSVYLADRLPYLKDYGPYGDPYSNFDANFTSYQLAHWTCSMPAVAGQNGSFLVVHWKEQYATSLAAIQPASLTNGTLVAANCYSAVPSSPAVDYANLVRQNVFVDTATNGPTGGSITTTPGGNTTTHFVSGVAFYSSPSGALTFNVQATCSDLFANSYFTNTAPSVSVPSAFVSTTAPVVVDMTDFGGDSHQIQLYDQSPPRIVNNVSGLGYSLISPPAVGHVARFENSTQFIGNSAAGNPYPYGQVRVTFNSPFGSPLQLTDSKKYLYSRNSVYSSASQEPFKDESYRYTSAFNILTSSPMVPVSAFPTTALTSNNGELQVINGRLVYPSEDFSAADYRPVQAGGRNYATVKAGDAANHKRRYQRAFNTLIAKNTGTLTIAGVSFTDFQATGGVDPAELTDHPGGVIIQIKIPGVTGWLDLGRPKGDPDLNVAADFRGCRTGINGSSYTFETGGFTAPNGAGQYLLVVRVTLIKGVGDAKFLTSITLT